MIHGRFLILILISSVLIMSPIISSSYVFGSNQTSQLSLSKATELHHSRIHKKSLKYWLPYVETILGPSPTENVVRFNIYTDNTTIKIDINHDNVPEYLFKGNKGDWISWYPPVEGAFIEVEGIADVYYRYVMNDYGAYEDGAFFYTLIEESFLGRVYYIPIKGKVTSVLSTRDRNVVLVDLNSDRIPDYRISLNRGELYKFTNLPVGAMIVSKFPIAVVIVNGEERNYDNTFALSLLPVNNLGRLYWVPKKHPYNYIQYNDISYITILAIRDKTRIFIDENNDGNYDISVLLNEGEAFNYTNFVGGAKILGNKKFYAIYRLLISAKDPWRGVFREYTSAFQLLSGNFGRHEYILRFLGPLPGHTPDNSSINFLNLIPVRKGTTIIEIDKEFDSIIDLRYQKKQGEIVTYGPEAPRFETMQASSNKIILAYISWMGNWVKISEHMAARMILVPELYEKCHKFRSFILNDLLESKLSKKLTTTINDLLSDVVMDYMLTVIIIDKLYNTVISYQMMTCNISSYALNAHTDVSNVVKTKNISFNN